MNEKDANNILGSIRASDEKIKKLNEEVGNCQVAILVVADYLILNQTKEAKRYLSDFIKKNNLKW